MYVLLSIQASACSFQDFDSLDKSWGLSVGGNTSGSAGGAGGTPNGGAGGAPNGGAGGTPNGGAGGTPGVDPPPEGNLMVNPSFESGHTGWLPFGMSTILDVSTGARSGTKCILSSGRSEAYMGPSYPAVNLLTPGSSYLMTAWLRMVTEPQTVQMTLKHVCDTDVDPKYTPAASVVVGTEWTKIEGVLDIPNCELLELTPYFEGPPANADFWVDDVSITLVE